MFGKFSFSGGVHPPHSKKQTSNLPIEIFPAPPQVFIPLAQHIGAPAKATVKRGDEVKIGQVIAESGGFVSSPIHSSVSGKVTSLIDMDHPLGKSVMGVTIENDGLDEKLDFSPVKTDWREAAREEIVNSIQAAGIVGMGGASFPTHVKLSPPTDKKIDCLIINGAECEPYLTADHRLLLEKTEEVLIGALILKRVLGAQQAYIGIEDNKLDAISVIESTLSKKQFSGLTLAKLKTKYPQGGEKQLINAVTKRHVPSGGLPMDCGCVVQNVGTSYAVWNAVVNGIPLYERVVTVTGPIVSNPKNLLVRIGTPARTLLDYCGVNYQSLKKFIMGGPMMGLAQSSLEIPVIKSTSGLLCLNSATTSVQDHPCISCGNCVKACPVHLVPSMLGKLINKEKFEEADTMNVLDCMECGSCAYVCPSKINLVHFMKLGKFQVMTARKAKK